jgi:TP901 family phage tail tape measure protein
MADASFVFNTRANTRQFERDMLSAYNRVQSGINRRKVTVDFQATGLNKLSGPLGRLNGQASEFTKSLEASNARVLAFGASVGVINAVTQGFQSLIRVSVEVEKVLADINSVLREDAAGLEAFSAAIFKTSKNTGQSFKIAAEAALELSRQGLNTEQTLGRLNNALILTRLGGLSAAESVETITAALNSFGKTVITDTQLVNKFSTVAAKFFVSEKDFADAIRRVGSSAQDAGVGVDEFIGLVTAAQQITARGGAVIGNSLKTIFTRLQRSSTLDELEGLGVAVRDLSGNTLPAIEILQSLANQLDKLSPSQQAYIQELTAGVFQINQLKAVLGDLSGEYSFYQAALESSVKSTDDAIRRNEELNNTYAALFNRLKEGVTQISATLGQDILGPISKIFGSITSSFDEVLGQGKAFEYGANFGSFLAKGLGEAIAGPLGVTLAAALVGVLKRITSFSARALTQLVGVVNKNIERKQIQGEINTLLQQEPQLLAQIANGSKSIEEIEKRILSLVRQRVELQSKVNFVSGRVAQSVLPGTFSRSQGALTGTNTRVVPGGASGSFAPNFADPLKDAIDREKRAGVPANQIYVDRDARLKSPSNPLGILVANRRDEPLGGFQGVDRAIALGMDPKKGGMQPSSIPNFALFDRAKDSSLKDIGGILLSPAEIDFVNKQIIEYGGALQEGSSVLKRSIKENIKKFPLDRESRILVERKLEQEEADFRQIKKDNKNKEKAAKQATDAAQQRAAVERKTAQEIQSKFGPQAAAGKLFPGIPNLTTRPNIVTGGGSRSVSAEEFEAARRAEQVESNLRASQTGGNVNASGVGAIRIPKERDLFDLNLRERERAEALADAQQKAREGKSLGPLERQALRETALRQAAQNPVFAGLSPQQILKNPRTKEELKRLTREIIGQFNDQSRAVPVNDALNRTFTPSFNPFRKEARDEAVFRRELGLGANAKLTPEQRAAFSQRRGQAVEARNARFGNAALIGSIAGSFAAPLIPEAGRSIFTNTLAGASIGSIFGGPAGILAGAGLGAAAGVAQSVSDRPERQLAKASAEFQKLSAEINAGSNGIQNYIQTQSKLNEIITSGSAKDGDIDSLNNSLTDIFKVITDQESRRGIIAAAGNIEQLGKVLSEFENRSALRQAKASIGVLTQSAVAGKAGNIFSGREFKTDDLTKIGEALFAANAASADFIPTIERISKLASSGNAKAAREELEKLDPALKAVESAIDISTITSAAVEFSKVNKELTKSAKINNDYLAQVAKFQREFIKLTNELINSQRETRLNEEANRRVAISSLLANIDNDTFGLTEGARLGVRSNRERAAIQGEGLQRKSALEDNLRSELQSFLSKNTDLAKQFLNQIGGSNPQDILNQVITASRDLSRGGKDPQGDLDQIEKVGSDFIRSLKELNDEQRERLEVQREQTNAERREIQRRQSLGLFGGAGFDSVDFSAIRAGRQASTGRLRGERILGGNTSGLDVQGVRATTQSFRSAEAQGIIARQALLPGLPTSDKDIDVVAKAREEDLAGKLNQFVASTLAGVLSDTSLAQTGLIGGQDLRRGVGEFLSRSFQKTGQADFAGASRFVQARLPDFGAGADIKRQLVEAFAEAERIRGTLPGAARDQAASLVQTEQQKQDAFVQSLGAEFAQVFNGEAIGRNTADTVARIDSLKEVFQKQFDLTKQSEQVKIKQGELTKLITERGEIQRGVEKSIGGSRFNQELLSPFTGGSPGKSIEKLISILSSLTGREFKGNDFFDSAQKAISVLRLTGGEPTLSGAREKILSNQELQPFLRTLVPVGQKITQETIESGLDKFLLEFTFASEKTKTASSSLSEFDTKINEASGAVAELVKSLESSQKTFADFVASKPGETGTTQSSTSVGSNGLLLTGKNGQTLSVDPASLKSVSGGFSGKTLEGKDFFTKNLDEESAKKVAQIVAAQEAAKVSGAQPYSFAGKVDPRARIDARRFTELPDMTADIRAATSPVGLDGSAGLEAITDVRKRVGSRFVDSITDPGFNNRGERTNKNEEATKKLAEQLAALDKTIASLKDAEAEKIKEYGVNFAESLVSELGEAFVPEFKAKLEQALTVKGQVFVSDGITTAEEIQDLDKFILKQIEIWFNKVQKDKQNESLKENGKAPIPSTSVK